MNKQIQFPWFVSALASIVLLAVAAAGAPASFAEPGYSIRCISVTPKRGTRLMVGEHVVLTITVAYKLTMTDKGVVALVLQKDDNSLLMPGHKQVQTEVPRGAGEITLKDEFDVPSGIRSVRLFVPLVPQGFTKTSGEVLIEYPVKKK